MLTSQDNSGSQDNDYVGANAGDDFGKNDMTLAGDILCGDEEDFVPWYNMQRTDLKSALIDMYVIFVITHIILDFVVINKWNIPSIDDKHESVGKTYIPTRSNLLTHCVRGTTIGRHRIDGNWFQTSGKADIWAWDIIRGATSLHIREHLHALFYIFILSTSHKSNEKYSSLTAVFYDFDMHV